MAPPSTSLPLLSPSELDFLFTSLRQEPLIRPDLRAATEFRPLVAETDILSSTNGSARVCFSDGTEAIAGVKAELERSSPHGNPTMAPTKTEDVDMEDDTETTKSVRHGKASDKWIEISIEIPGFRDDDALPVFLAAMLTEALLANGNVQNKLWINERWHWKLYIDILSLSPPLAYPLPLLSLTTHLALLRTALPKLISEPGDDPLFDDDWAESVSLFPKNQSGIYLERPPITLLVMTVGENIIFDPTKEELAVAENVVAASIALRVFPAGHNALDLVAIRSIDPPSRLTPPGVPNKIKSTTPAAGPEREASLVETPGTHGMHENIWKPPRGGLKRPMLAKIIQSVLEPGGVGSGVLEGLAAARV